MTRSLCRRGMCPSHGLLSFQETRQDGMKEFYPGFMVNTELF